MLAKMLRVTIAMQMVFGAALGYWLAGGGAGLATTLLTMFAAALLLPPLASLLTLLHTFVRSGAEGPWRLRLQALLGECLASMRFFLLRQPWAFAAPALLPASGTQAAVPVLLVHGFVCNYRVWEAMVPALRAQGHAVLAINLEPLFASIDDYAPQIEQAVQTLCQHSGQSQVALVGHSMGGLAIRAWVRRYGTARVARAITLGTPHAGTQAKAMVNTANSVQAVWQSDWLQALAASESEASRSLLRIALTPQDNIVYPQRAQVLAGVEAKVFEGCGHLQLLCDAKVRQWVCQQLTLR